MNTVPQQLGEPMYGWYELPWKKFEQQVFKLQKRIYRASNRGDVKAVHKLQRLLVKSRSARYLAVRKVTQDNRGKRTAGVDGIASLTPKQRLGLADGLTLSGKARPLRRVWIPKPGSKDGEKRPLSIPVVRDRARQALAKLALEPEWEAKFEPNSYGFRPGRSGHDAIAAIRIGIQSKPKYVLDADITKCFDRICHRTLLQKLSTFPRMRKAIKDWLKAGIMDGDKLFSTDAGTPQGGVVSPLLANVALHGLEEHVMEAFPKHRGTEPWKPRVIRYADDFVVLHRDLEAIEQTQRVAEEWLRGIGLELKPSKTRITHTLHEHDGNVGLEFLGFEIRQYRVGKTHSGKNAYGQLLGFKTIVRPTKSALDRHMTTLKEIVDAHKAAPQAALILRLNPVIRGWANYYRMENSSEVFKKADHLLYLKLKRWAEHRHRQKSKSWVAKKYWNVHKGKGWSFKSERDQIRLQQHADVRIQKHVKVWAGKSPYDGDWIYWSTRMTRHPELSTTAVKLLKWQKGICPWCCLYFKSGDLLEIDHKIPIAKGGKGTYSNKQILHGHCHDDKTALDFTSPRGIYDKDHTAEEPDEGKLSRPVLETSRHG